MAALAAEDRASLVESVRQVLERGGHAMSSDLVDGGQDERRLWSDVTGIGLPAIAVPEAAGGVGASLADASAVIEEFSRQLAGGPFVPTFIFAQLLAAAPELASGRALLERIAAGDVTGTVAHVARTGQLAPAAVVARPAGDGGFDLEGEAAFVPEAESVEMLAVLARDVWGAPVTAIIGTDHPQVRVVPTPTNDPSRHFAEVHFHRARVPAHAVLCQEPALAAESQALAVGAIAMAADSLGAAAKALERTVDHVSNRMQFDRPVGSFQAVKHRCADMLIRLEAVRASVDLAADSVDLGGDAVEAAAIAKSFTGDAAVSVCADALLLHGGMGFTWEAGLHRYLRRVRLNRVLFGTPAWHRRRLASTVLHRPAQGSPSLET